jgi:hypothetical protein
MMKGPDMTVHVEELYILMIEHQGGDIQIAKSDHAHSNKIIVAREGNQKYLEQIGQGLLDAELILGYQLLRTAAAPVRGYEILGPDSFGLGLPSGCTVVEP